MRSPGCSATQSRKARHFPIPPFFAKRVQREKREASIKENNVEGRSVGKRLKGKKKWKDGGGECHTGVVDRKASNDGVDMSLALA